MFSEVSVVKTFTLFLGLRPVYLLSSISHSTIFRNSLGLIPNISSSWSATSIPPVWLSALMSDRVLGQAAQLVVGHPLLPSG
jgi:hypothetical protein